MSRYVDAPTLTLTAPTQRGDSEAKAHAQSDHADCSDAPLY